MLLAGMQPFVKNTGSKFSRFGAIAKNSEIQFVLENEGKRDRRFDGSSDSNRLPNAKKNYTSKFDRYSAIAK